MNRSLIISIGLLLVFVTIAPANAEFNDDPVQRAALMALYNSTDGPNWNDNDGWDSEASYCTWYGVSCSETDDVLQLSLLVNGLSGTIPPELGNLSHLEWLNMNANDLSGSIPPDLGTLGNLRGLAIHSNNLSGTIPLELGDLINLYWFTLSSNNLSGSIPPELGNLTNVGDFSLNNNNLEGPIPPELGNLIGIGNLGGLWLGGNNLSGPIPPELGNLNAGSLSLGPNQLSGPIPAALSNLGFLKYLKLSENPDLTCWETLAALIWAKGLPYYEGPEFGCGFDVSTSWLPFLCSAI